MTARSLGRVIFPDKMAGLHEVISGGMIMKPSSKVAIYWILVVAGSFIHDFTPLPQSYFSSTKNVFNVYFVKFSWGWTASTLIVLLTSSRWTSGNKPIARHYSRILVAAFSWYFWTNLFIYVEDLTAVCEGEESFMTRHSCKSHGFYWNGFDISGHTFILIHCCLVISEELQPLKDKEPRQAHVRFAVCCIVILQLLWEFMLVCTAVYFHTVQQKILGAVVAISNWWFTYHLWYNTKLSPGMPGDL